ncbi:amidohydrolase [Amycolatopsis acidicola]|uniref:Peptidase M20 domain-containing protein 2 n=1 Tax=Amycolatopsis acidicola TaxID=2596893 RepID=A0A5N0V183_9PSEU|nr:amidohydrolase [Amycolatopsis acidicola]KAA9158049.1 amidohydrolase [Amycolatopsis acidicola]
MTGPEELKSLACAEIDRRAGEIVALSEDIMRHPETGYREFRTADVVAGQLEALGLTPETGLARTGVKARMSGRAAGPTVGILSELDSLVIPDHPYADPETGAAHACGHNSQIAAMVGAGIGLATVHEELDGDVVLFAVPAEECIQTSWRLGLRDAGELHHTAGKAELIRRGHFDDVDLALLTHAGTPEPALGLGFTGTGSLLMRVRFHGKAAHAAASPEAGISAYKAATVAIAAIDAHREMFREGDGIRVHHLITHSGAAVSSIPALTEMEILVRAHTIDALRATAKRVEGALRGGALAMGADVEILTTVSFLPYADDAPLAEVVEANARELVGDGYARLTGSGGGSTDMGDLSRVMPVVQAMAAAGVDAPFHGNAFHTADHVSAAVVPAKLMAMTAIDLLHDGAARAREVIAGSGPKLSREDFAGLHDSLTRESVFRSTDHAL